MRIVLGDPSSGEVGTYNVPTPELRAGGVLVRTSFSAISAGTERATVETGSKSMVGKALTRPDLVRKVFDYAHIHGVRAAYHKIQSRLQTLTPMGYSCAGTILAIGEGVTGFNCGDRVACAGAGFASHCEINWIPQNLAITVPEKVSLEAASLSTIGAIALQGLRQSQVNFGETVAVIGAGLVGALTIQLARAAGCKVVAIDLDAKRAQRAATLGAHLAVQSSEPKLEQTIREFSRYGADVAIITAAARSAEPVELATRIVRDRGRIVVVGDVKMDVSRPNMYHKELSLVMSRSYGPGRYDPSYEEDGHDYPLGYIRWTEKRNMEAFLDCLASGSVDVGYLLGRRYPVEHAATAYTELGSSELYTVILEYPAAREPQQPTTLTPRTLTHGVVPGKLRVGCIGAGGFAREHIFPRLKAETEVDLQSVATASGNTAESARKAYGFTQAQSPAELLQNPDLDAVFVLTHHASHARYAVQALEQQKLVFVEKPLAVDREQLEKVRQAYEVAKRAGHRAFLMVGFNRRFAPATHAIRSFFAERQEPMVVHVRVNAGYIPREHWTQRSAEGGRIIGELCHFVDWARTIVGEPIRGVSATALPDKNRYNRDNVVASLSFHDGSVANLLYLANGDKAVSKEYFEVFCQGKIARLDDFRILELVDGGKTRRIKSGQDKGHNAELHVTLECMRSGKDAPITFEELLGVTEATFSIEDAIRSAQTVPIASDVQILEGA